MGISRYDNLLSIQRLMSGCCIGARCGDVGVLFIRRNNQSISHSALFQTTAVPITTRFGRQSAKFAATGCKEVNA